MTPSPHSMGRGTEIRCSGVRDRSLFVCFILAEICQRPILPLNQAHRKVMPHQVICEQCGSELPANAPQGLCPQCLAGMGLKLVEEMPAVSMGFKERRSGSDHFPSEP